MKTTTMKMRNTRHEPRSRCDRGQRGASYAEKDDTMGRQNASKGNKKSERIDSLLSLLPCYSPCKFWRLISSVSSRAPLYTPWWWQMIWPSDIQSRVALPCRLSVWPAFRERDRERGGREMAKSLWDSGTALRQVNSQITQPNTSAALSLCTFVFSFLSCPRVIKCEGVCRLGSYTAGNSPPSSYSSSCPSRTLLSPSVTSRCERLRPLGLCQDQYVWMLGKPLGHATEWH